jgi:hypothetical protein
VLRRERLTVGSTRSDSDYEEGDSDGRTCL